MFSRRSAFETEKNPLSRALEVARGRGAPLLDLTISNPTKAGVPYDGERLLSALASPGALRYTPEPFGLIEARRAVTALWAERGLEVTSDRVAMTASTSEAYAYAFKLLCDPGDEVLVPAPSYPLLEELARLESIRLRRYPLDYDGSWFIDPGAVVRARSERTRAVVVVSPNNPTGSYLKRAELAALAELGLPIVSDEVFAEYPLRPDPSRARSALECDATLVLALDGLSKLAALPQAKLAWLTLGGPKAAVDEARRRLEPIADAFLSPGSAVQLGLPALLAARGTAGDAIRARLLRNLARLDELSAGTALTPLFAEGGWYVVVRFPATRSDEEWAMALLERGVIVQPGYYFELGDPPCAVVSLLTPEDEFEAGVARLVALVAEA